MSTGSPKKIISPQKNTLSLVTKALKQKESVASSTGGSDDLNFHVK